jgi:hypothetical protein
VATRILSWGRAALHTLALALAVAACGSDPPIGPSPPPPPPPPPVNTVPVITSITVQGTRPRQPANFADVGETVPVTAVVTDAETAPELLQYNWTATVGSFTGTGAKVSWVAPAAAVTVTPAAVTITLQVVERFGTNLQNTVTRTAPVALHDSVKEVGDMSRQFLIDFSDTDLDNATYIMRNFGNAQTCPDPGELIDERDQVISHYTNFRMVDFTIGLATVSVNFGGVCAISGKQGDACAVVPARWNSIDLRVPNARPQEVNGLDRIAASYARNEGRWRLCASNYYGATLSGSRTSFYIR